MENLELELMIYYDKLGKSLMATNDFSKGTKRVFKEQAKYYQWITYRPRQLLTYLLFDFDENDPFFIDKIKELGLLPNITIQNPNSQKGQILFRLNDPVPLGEKTRKEPVRYYNNTRKALNNAFGCDNQYTNRFAKNPFFTGGFYDKKNKIKLKENFILDCYSNKGYDLSDFSSFLHAENVKEYERKKELKINHKHRTILESTEKGNRNNGMFQHSRWFAYSIVAMYRRNNDRDSFFNAVLKECIYFNNHCAEKLPDKEVLDVATSVSNWTYRNHCPDEHKEAISKSKRRIHKGKLALKVAHCQSIQEKQIVAASETNKTRKRSTENKIKNAIYSLKADGLKITQKAVAERSRLGIATIKRYSKLIKSLK